MQPAGRSSVWTIVVAAGAGQRFGAFKQYEVLGERRVVDWCTAVAQAVSGGVVLVVPAGHVAEAAAGADPGCVVVAGGDTRSASVRCGLAAVPADAEVVLVHDGARPFASRMLFEAVVAAVQAGADGVVPGVPVTDTVKEVDASGVVLRTPPRDALVAVQTPQGFRASALRAAHAAAPEATDDAAVVEAAGGRVVVVPGEVGNRKITVPDDLAWARARVAAGEVHPCG